MQGMTENTKQFFEKISTLSCLSGYTLVGGTALSFQINHRLSEDLDFCRWSKNLKKDKPTVDWPQIEKELNTIGTISSKDILSFEQVNFLVDNIKLTFFTKQDNLNPVSEPVRLYKNVVAADLTSIGYMKIEVMLRRSEFKDYYDLYAILKEGISLKDLVRGATVYSGHNLKTRDILNFLSDGHRFKKPTGFELLKPKYIVLATDIENYIREKIKEEYSVNK